MTPIYCIKPPCILQSCGLEAAFKITQVHKHTLRHVLVHLHDTQTNKQTHTHTHTHKHKQTNTHTQTHTHTHTQMYIQICVKEKLTVGNGTVNDGDGNCVIFGIHLCTQCMSLSGDVKSAWKKESSKAMLPRLVTLTTAFMKYGAVDGSNHIDMIWFRLDSRVFSHLSIARVKMFRCFFLTEIPCFQGCGGRLAPRNTTRGGS